MASTITSSTGVPAIASGRARFRRSTRACSRSGRWRRADTGLEPRSTGSRRPSTRASTGPGCSAAMEWSLRSAPSATAGSRKLAGSPTRWDRYNEAAFLYLLAMGSPEKAIGPVAWDQWQVEMAEVEGYPVFGGPAPLFWAQMTPGLLRPARMRPIRQGRNWWLNFRNAHLATHAYCARNPDRKKPNSTCRGGSRPATSRNGRRRTPRPPAAAAGP